MMMPEARAPAVARVLAWRPWALAFSAFLAAAGSVLWLARGTPSDPDLEVLTVLCLYLSFACTFVPLPTAWIVLWAARETGAFPVALVATAGTCIANMHDYYIVSGLWRLGRLKRARESARHARAVAWFRRAPFVALALASFAPLPVDAVRLLAISAGYPRTPFVLATFAGRFPRYLLLAILGHELRPSNRAIAAFVLVILVAGAAKAAVDHRRERLRRRAPRADHDDA